jgi:hypothetical protein
MTFLHSFLSLSALQLQLHGELAKVHRATRMPSLSGSGHVRRMLKADHHLNHHVCSVTRTLIAPARLVACMSAAAASS